jgi:hypothetical protein
MEGIAEIAWPDPLRLPPDPTPEVSDIRQAVTSQTRKYVTNDKKYRQIS